jgi:hypothetical protein
MVQLAKTSSAGLLTIASVILGLEGAGSVVASVFIFAGPEPHQSALASAVSGIIFLAAGMALMVWARHLSRHPDGEMRRTHRMGLIFVAAALTYVGASDVLILVFIQLGHGLAEYGSVASQLALGVGGVALLAIAVGLMQRVRHLQTR